MKKEIIKKALVSTIPVMSGYVVLGIGFGILMSTNGLNPLWSLLMSLFIYAGSMQYVAIGLLTGGASFLTTALTTLMVNARHLFYGISMIDKYSKIKKGKLYDIFGLTDETYALVVEDRPDIQEEDLPSYYFLVSILDQSYWVTGSMIGALLGTMITFDTTGIDFSLTALFIAIFTEQCVSNGNRKAGIIGVVSSVVCLILFGPGNFLIPSMILITVLLCTMRKSIEQGGGQNE
ncbi:MAG: AzlC family ABC transporter permease [Firmicutes bacterium]|nr:AzlC family ABC transporter permease [Bacillota bacterium]